MPESAARSVRVERRRWRFVRLLDRSRRFCWADLVTWVLGMYAGEEGYRLRDAAGAPARCGPGSGDYERNGCCYCGKFMTDELRAACSAPSQEVLS